MKPSPSHLVPGGRFGIGLIVDVYSPLVLDSVEPVVEDSVPLVVIVEVGYLVVDSGLDVG